MYLCRQNHDIMADHDIIFRYFPQMDAEQRSRIEALDALYREWNARINVISRRDIDNLYTAHILHSLAIAAFLGPLEPGTAFLDMGTGGGLPGIPLAIAYPECSFHLIDRIGKKIRVATEIASALGLRNVTFQHGDIGECRERYDYVVSRAVMTLDALVPLITKNVRRGRHGVNRYADGLVCLKGGDLSAEIAATRRPVLEYDLREFVPEDCFDTKKLIYVPFD